MGIYVRGKRLYFTFKGPAGKWQSARSEYLVGQEALAQKAFASLVDRIAAGAAIIGDRKKAVTLEEYAELQWFATRRGLVAGADRDEGRLRLHVFPLKRDPQISSIHLGKMPLEEIRARHLKTLFSIIRRAKVLAPKSIHNVYGVLQALFRDAEIEGLIDRNPCILNHHQLGKNVDKDSEWRKGAQYTRAELEQLVADQRIPLERRVMYGLEGIGGLRHGEAAGLRWRHLDTTTRPLGQLQVATSYNDGHTKTWVTRYQPIHPVLGALLAEWKLSGWAAMLGRTPGPDDLVVPTPVPTNRGRRLDAGSMRTSSWSWKRFKKDLAMLGFRHRRGHDLRRTFISLARSDGALMDIVKRGTHKPPREVIDGYTTFEFDVQCREMLKLQLHPGGGELIALPTAVGSVSAPGRQAVEAEPAIGPPSEGAIHRLSKPANPPMTEVENSGGGGNRSPVYIDPIAPDVGLTHGDAEEIKGSDDADEPDIGRRQPSFGPAWIGGMRPRRHWRTPAIRTLSSREVLAQLAGGAA